MAALHRARTACALALVLSSFACDDATSPPAPTDAPPATEAERGGDAELPDADAPDTGADAAALADGEVLVDGGAPEVVDGGAADVAAASARGGQSSAAELALLTRARRSVRSSPTRALSVTIDHQRRFKQPHHAELREAIAIEALVRLGRAGEARARARQYFLSYPKASEGARIRMLLDHNAD